MYTQGRTLRIGCIDVLQDGEGGVVILALEGEQPAIDRRDERGFAGQ